MSADIVKSSGVAWVTVLADEAVVKQIGCCVSVSRQKNVCAILYIVDPSFNEVKDVLFGIGEYSQDEYNAIVGAPSIFVGSYQLLEYFMIATPVITFMLVTVGIGEVILRKQVKNGTFLMDQYVPDFSYVD